VLLLAARDRHGACARPGREAGGREARFLVVLALPFVAVAPFLHPVGGLFRDWDDFAAMGSVLSMLTAALVGETLRRAARPWLAVAVALAVAAPAFQWLALHTATDRGIERALAAVSEPPARAGTERASMNYLGMRNYQLERWRASADAPATRPRPRPARACRSSRRWLRPPGGDFEARAYHPSREGARQLLDGWGSLPSPCAFRTSQSAAVRPEPRARIQPAIEATKRSARSWRWRGGSHCRRRTDRKHEAPGSIGRLARARAPTHAQPAITF
jgi:hypothetical protein